MRFWCFYGQRHFGHCRRGEANRLGMQARVNQSLNVLKHRVIAQARPHTSPATPGLAVVRLCRVIPNHRVPSFFQVLPDLVETAGLHLTLKHLEPSKVLFDLVPGLGTNHSIRISSRPQRHIDNSPHFPEVAFGDAQVFAHWPGKSEGVVNIPVLRGKTDARSTDIQMCQQTRLGHSRRLPVTGHQAFHHTVAMPVTQRMGNRHQTTGFVQYQDTLVLVQNTQFSFHYLGNPGVSPPRRQRPVLLQQGHQYRQGFRHGRNNR